MFYQDLFNCMFAWWRSRRCWRMSMLAFLPVTVLLAAILLVIWGAFTTSQTLYARHFDLVEDEVDANFNELVKPVSSDKPAPGQTLSEQSSGDGSVVSPVPDGQPASASESQASAALSRAEERRVQVPLRRCLQLGNYNPRVAYMVAIQLARQGRLAMAARMMRDIAPSRKYGEDKAGFAYAHLWLAEYAKMNWKGSDAEAETLLGDLDAAERGGVTLNSAHVRYFAQLLVHFKHTQEAMSLLSDYALRYPELNLMYAILSEQAGHVGVQFQGAIKAARESFDAKQKEGKLTTQDWYHRVQLELYDKKIDQAVVIADAGFRSDPKNPDLRRLFSNVLLAKYKALTASLDGKKASAGSPLAGAAVANERNSVENAQEDSAGSPKEAVPPDGDVADLSYLEKACQVDSANPDLVPELAKAVAMGRSLNPELKQVYENSLADGTAPGITHLILANSKLTGTSPEGALPHLRLALSKMPNSPVVMNNLAYALMKYAPDKLSEAQQLMERALSIPGSSVSNQASMLDTLGEIRLAQGETLKAIELLEKAIELDGSKLDVRRRLVEGYRKADMPELAEAQLRRINELSGKK